MDCDLQDEPENIPTLLKYLKSNNAEIVYTIKSGDLGSWFNKLTSRLYHFTFSKVTKAKIPPNIGTFRLFTKKVLQNLLQYGEINILYGPLMFYIGFESVFLTVTHNQRNFGKSNYSFWKRLFMAIDSLMSYTNFPNKVFIFIGTMVLSGSLFYSFTILVSYLIFGRELPEGLTLIVVLITSSTGIIILSLGIVGSYVFRVYQEILRRPRYLISEQVNI